MIKIIQNLFPQEINGIWFKDEETKEFFAIYNNNSKIELVFDNKDRGKYDGHELALSVDKSGIKFQYVDNEEIKIVDISPERLMELLKFLHKSILTFKGV